MGVLADQLGGRRRDDDEIGFAAEALARGAAVTVVLGPGAKSPPAGVDVVTVGTAEEMREAVLARVDEADAVVMAAAVADFRPKAVAEAKLKKEAGVPELLLEPTPDILGELGERGGRQVLVGFAAETDDLEAAGRAKLAAKHLDLVVVNRVGRAGTGFGSDTNEALLLGVDGGDIELRAWTKRDLAAAILTRVAELLADEATGVPPGR